MTARSVRGLRSTPLAASVAVLAALTALPMAADAADRPIAPPAGSSHLSAAVAKSAQKAVVPPALARLLPSQDQDRTSGALPQIAAQMAPPTSLQAWLDQAPTQVSGAPGNTPPPASATVAVQASGASAPDPAAVASILDLDTHNKGAPSPTQGLASGQAIAPFLPTEDDFSHQAAQAIVQAFATPKGGVAGDVASPAAADLTPADPDFDERVGLVMTLYQVDGTEAVIRHFVATQHMKLIIKEVKNHIDLSRLSEGDKYRLASIAAIAQTELEDKILLLNARIQAANLTKADLMQLIVAYDSDAQRKLTQQRLGDDGKQDQLSGIDVVISEYTILRDFIARQ